MVSKVLVIDDDAAFRLAMSKALRRKGIEVVQAADGQSGIKALLAAGPGGPEAAVLDLRLPDLDGLEVLRRTLSRRIPVIVLTGHGTIPDAVKAMRLGAFTFMLKPVDADELFAALDQAAGTSPTAPAEMIGSSPAMKQLRQVLEQIADADDPVLLLGETGTGKEVAASYVHAHSRRAARPFVAVNLGGLPRDLFESELFGYIKGAFTGADRKKSGLLTEAEDGTLFLDEIGELPLEHQVKLLRVFETRKFRTLGDLREESLSARLITATNRNLALAVRAGSFREDLYFRLRVLPVEIPALRQRKEDILPIAHHWLSRLSRRPLILSDEACEALLDHHYPGNVRELVNIVRRITLFVAGDTIEGALVKRMLVEEPLGQLPVQELPRDGILRRSDSRNEEGVDELALRRLERQHIERLLKEYRNVTLVARMLQIDRRTLQRKLKSLGIDNDWRD